MISPPRHPSTLRWKADAIVRMGTGVRPGLKGPNCSLDEFSPELGLAAYPAPDDQRHRPRDEGQHGLPAVIDAWVGDDARHRHHAHPTTRGHHRTPAGEAPAA